MRCSSCGKETGAVSYENAAGEPCCLQCALGESTGQLPPPADRRPPTTPTSSPSKQPSSTFSADDSAVLETEQKLEHSSERPRVSDASFEDERIKKWLAEGLINEEQAQKMLGDVTAHRKERSSDKLIGVMSTIVGRPSGNWGCPICGLQLASPDEVDEGVRFGWWHFWGIVHRVRIRLRTTEPSEGRCRIALSRKSPIRSDDLLTWADLSD